MAHSSRLRAKIANKIGLQSIIPIYLLLVDIKMKQFLDSILKEDVQNFIVSHENTDVQKLLLKQKTVHGVPTLWIAQQLTGRKKARSKLPEWYNTKGIVYPPSLNLEQSSSEATAKFKERILNGISLSPPAGSRAADLTGGFGVDTYFLSKVVQIIDYVEPEVDLLDISNHNHNRLGANNINHHQASAVTFLTSTKEKIDFLYLDPSRRRAARKVYKLADCAPDVLELQKVLLQKANLVMIKTSPLLDIRQGSKELQNVLQIIVVAVENECKEVLFILQQGFGGKPLIRAMDLTKRGEIATSFSFTFDEEKNSIAHFASPLGYLLEPNSAILKAGAFKWISQKYNLKKLAPGTHLYTSDELIRNFPGRIFKITESVKLNTKLKDKFDGGYANILTRNFPLSVDAIKKKTGLKEGGDHYLVCAQTKKEKVVVVAEKVN